jgi:hypothetical protein
VVTAKHLGTWGEAISLPTAYKRIKNGLTSEISPGCDVEGTGARPPSCYQPKPLREAVWCLIRDVLAVTEPR